MSLKEAQPQTGTQRMTRGTFLWRTVVGVTALGVFSAGCSDSSLGAFENKYGNQLLKPGEKNLRAEWVSKIAQTLSLNTNFSGKAEELTNNFHFAFSAQEYLDRYHSFPSSEVGKSDFTNGVTVISDTGIEGSAVYVSKVIDELQGRPFNPVRVVGIVCAHEMGHRTELRIKELEEPFFLPGRNAIMKVTGTLGLKLLGFDSTNPRRPLNFLAPLDQTGAEIQAQRTYKERYSTPGAPLREAPALLSRMQQLMELLCISQDSLFTYKRNNDPVGLLSEISDRIHVFPTRQEKITFGIEVSTAALSGDMEKVRSLISNPT